MKLASVMDSWADTMVHEFEAETVRSFAREFMEIAEEIVGAFHSEQDDDRMRRALKWAVFRAAPFLIHATAGGVVGSLAATSAVGAPEAVMECAIEVEEAHQAAEILLGRPVNSASVDRADVVESFRRRVMAARQEANLTQEQVSQLLGANPKRYERESP